MEHVTDVFGIQLMQVSSVLFMFLIYIFLICSLHLKVLVSC